MKKEYLIIAIIALVVLTLVSSVPAMQSTSISEYQPVCPEESYNKITELYEEGLSEDEIAEELAFPVGIVTQYLKGEYIPPVYPEPDQRMPLSECPTYSKIKDLYGEGWSEEEIAETLELPIDVVGGFLSGNYTIISACPEPYQKSEKNVSSSDLIGKDEVSDKQSETGRYEVTITPSEDELLGKYEKSDRPFKKSVSNRTITYVHRRKIDGIKVTRDRITYVFDKNTKELIRNDIQWRDDLPEHLPLVIPKEQAELITGRGSATLCFLSKDSHVYPIKPAPKNPCWVVWKTTKTENGIPYYNITIVDAVEGKILGYGIPPPSTGFSFSGPQNVSTCSGVWSNWYQNAESWFNTMGYSTEAVVYPNEAKVKSHIQSYETAMFYEVAHGNYDYFTNDCSGDPTTADVIHDWIFEDLEYTLMPFTFLASCGGMCEVGSGTLSYEFRKGSSEAATTVGYCGMGSSPCNTTCWAVVVDWQDAMFNYMNQGWTVKAAFDQACEQYDEECYNESAGIRCVRFAGDEDFAVVPVVERGMLGDVNRNGFLDTGDVTLILRYIVGLPIPPECQPVYPIGDMNNNHRIDTGDGTLILRKIVGLLSGGTSAPAPVATEPVALDIGSYTAYVKSDITVPVEISNASAVAGGSVKILFDSSIVEVKAVKAGDFNEPVANIDNENGFVHIAVSRATAVGIEKAVLANITFTGISEDSTALKIQQSVLNYEDGNTREPKMSDGEIRTMNYDDMEALKETLEKNAEVFGKVYEEYPERG